MTTSDRQRQQKRGLYRRQKGLCYYCQRFMRLMKWGREYGACPHDLATIEHLDSRYSPERGQHAGEFRKVLACWKCNNDKNREEQARYFASAAVRH